MKQYIINFTALFLSFLLFYSMFSFLNYVGQSNLTNNIKTIIQK